MAKIRELLDMRTKAVEKPVDTPPSRSTRKRRARLTGEKDEGSDSDATQPLLRATPEAIAQVKTEAEAQASESDSPLSSPPPELPKKSNSRTLKGPTGASRPRKSTTLTVTHGNLDALPVPKRRGGGGRGGGNKRKHTHEYCLTCSNYGRACGGRRGENEGCAVCREPDRSKGEKLRECLWAEPENGIFTYQQAKEVIKIAQAEERARLGKPPTKRQMPFLTTEQARKYLEAPDPLHLVEDPSRSYAARPPPVSRPLNLLPPPAVSGFRRDLGNSGRSVTRAGSFSADVNLSDTIVVDTSGRHPMSQPATKLFVEEGTPDTQIRPLLPGNLVRESSAGTQAHRQPYYDPRLEAYVLPVYPHSNILPPHMQDKVANKAFIPVNEALQSVLPIIMQQEYASRPAAQGNRSLSRPAPQSNNGNSRSAFALASSQPLSKSIPSRKWSISNSTVDNVSGYPVSMKAWSSTDGSMNGVSHIEKAKEKSNNAETPPRKSPNPKLNNNLNMGSAIDIDTKIRESFDQDVSYGHESKLVGRPSYSSEPETDAKSTVEIIPAARAIGMDDDNDGSDDGEETACTAPTRVEKAENNRAIVQFTESVSTEKLGQNDDEASKESNVPRETWISTNSGWSAVNSVEKSRVETPSSPPRKKIRSNNYPDQRANGSGS